MILILKSIRLNTDNILEEDVNWEPVSDGKLGIEQFLARTSKSGTVKFLKFDPGAKYPLHFHPDRSEWLCVISGDMNVEIDGRRLSLHGGGFVSFPVNSKHSLAAGENGALITVSAFFESA